MEKPSKINEFIEIIFNGELSNEEVVQFIELSMSYLNAKTITEYAKHNNLSYNGVKRFRKIIKIRNVKFVIDND